VRQVPAAWYPCPMSYYQEIPILTWLDQINLNHYD
jgi:hypothetical protein